MRRILKIIKTTMILGIVCLLGLTIFILVLPESKQKEFQEISRKEHERQNNKNIEKTATEETKEQSEEIEYLLPDSDKRYFEKYNVDFIKEHEIQEVDNCSENVVDTQGDETYDNSDEFQAMMLKKNEG
ncbi:MAG: hypothetical protein SOV36_05160 [Anaerostipes faecalis]|nr:hypothetical protein [Anaerostipes faecalis]